jgi:diketogulonate reductase-like aldo/keto reductase
MQGVVISNAGVRMPGILYGTAWKKQDTAALVALALRQGFRGIDTACQPRHYNEPGVGAGIAQLAGVLTREQLYLQTKFTPPAGQDATTIPYDPHAPLAQQVRQSCAISLRNLGTSYLDALVLHSPLPSLEETLEAWSAMEDLVTSGQVRQLGISNCYSDTLLAALHRMARIKPAVVQNRFYADTDYDALIRDFCAAHGIIYQSFWTLTANPHLLANPLLRELAATHGCEPPQVLFRYLTQRGVVPLTGTRQAQHMRQDLAIFDFELPAVALTAIAGLLV